jgi:hypothetical protein
MKQYVFGFETDGLEHCVWDEVIRSEHMLDAFSEAQKLSKRYAQEKAVLVHVQFKGVKYNDIA